MKKIGFWLFLLLSVSPLIYFKKYNFGYHTPKVLFFWLLVIVFSIIKSIRLYNSKQIVFSINLIGISIIVYTSVLLMSGVQAQSPALSFYSTFERMDGIVNYVFLVLFYFMLSHDKFEPKEWKIIGKFSIVIAVIVSIIAISEYLKGDSVRSQSTFANILALAFYLVFHFLLIFNGFINKLIHKKAFKLSEDLIKTLFLIIIGFGIVTTSARSAIVSLFFGILAIGIYCFIVYKNSRKKIGLVFGGIMSLGIAILIKLTSLNIMLSRIGDFSLTDNSVFVRFSIWKTVFTFWKDKPLLGWGKEHFVYFFARHYQNAFHISDDWYDRSHNFLIDKFLESGLLGFMSYCAIIGVSIWTVLQKGSQLTNFQKGSILALILSFISFHFTNFESYSSYLIIFLLFIFISQQTSSYKYILKSNIKPAILFFVLLLSFMGYFFVVKTFQNYKTWNNIKLTTDNIYFVNEYDQLLKETEIGKYDILLKFALARTLLNNNTNMVDVRDSYYKKATYSFQNSIIDYPNHPILLSQLGFIQFESGNTDDAIRTYESLKLVAPYRHTNIIDLGTMYMLSKQYDKAIKLYDYLISFDNVYQITYLNKAYCLALKGDKLNALKTLKLLSPQEIENNLDKYNMVKALL